MGLILLILLVFFFLGSAPAYPYSRDWGYRPMGLVSLLLIVLVVLILMNMVPVGFGLHHPWYRPVGVAP